MTYTCHVALEVWRQAFNQKSRLQLLHGRDRLCKMVRSAIWHIISVDTCQHDVVNVPGCNSCCCVDRLIWVRRRWGPGCVDGAEAATTCACVSQHHNGGCCHVTIPALANVWALCFLAHSCQLQTSHLAKELCILVTLWCPLPQPRRLLRVGQLGQTWSQHGTPGLGSLAASLYSFPAAQVLLSQTSQRRVLGDGHLHQLFKRIHMRRCEQRVVLSAGGCWR
mmetsp:Transcript_35445/g.104828  ORF Transcript_35445/g.104828 Transcript_35445/m.104828 type:complete len:222 (-) Transcript_35445:393-1058(-)